MANVRDLVVNILLRKKGDGARQAAADLDRTKKSADAAGASFQDFADDNDRLSRSIQTTRDRIRELHRDIARSGGEDTHFFGDLRKEESQLRRLMKTARALTPGGGRRGADLDLNLPKVDFSQMVGESRGILIAGLVGTLAVLSPIIGAMIAGAVTGVVGMGGIAGGVAAAAKDPGVRRAASELVSSLSAEWDQLGASFAGPTEEAVRILDQGLRDMNWSDAFKETLPYVDDLAKGFAALGRNFMPGFTAALRNSGPFIEVMSEELGELGSALGDMFKDMSESQGAIMGLRAFFNLLEGTVTSLGTAMEGLSEAFLWLSERASEFWGETSRAVDMTILSLTGLDESLADVSQWHRNFIDDADRGGQSAVYFASGLSQAEREANALRVTMMSLSGAFNDWFGIAMNADQATLRAATAYRELAKTLSENGKQWDINTEKGQNNRQALLAAVDALERERTARIEEGGGTAEAVASANAWYETQLKWIEALAKQSGITKAALKDLVGDYHIRVFIDSLYNPVGTVATGVEGAIAAMIESIHGALPQMVGPAQGFSSGGTTPAFAPFYAHPGEVMFDSQEHYVATAAQVGAMQGGGQSGYGGGFRVVIDVTGADEDLKRLVRKWVRIDGGGNVQTAFGRD